MFQLRSRLSMTVIWTMPLPQQLENGAEEGSLQIVVAELNLLVNLFSTSRSHQ